jgi:hypothetical protein
VKFAIVQKPRKPAGWPALQNAFNNTKQVNKVDDAVICAFIQLHSDVYQQNCHLHPVCLSNTFDRKLHEQLGILKISYNIRHLLFEQLTSKAVSDAHNDTNNQLEIFSKLQLLIFFHSRFFCDLNDG